MIRIHYIKNVEGILKRGIEKKGPPVVEYNDGRIIMPGQYTKEEALGEGVLRRKAAETAEGYGRTKK